MEHHRNTVMTEGFSLSLDLARFCAAMVVLVVHFGYDRISGGLLWQPGPPFAHHAVVVFFVLSGLVMAHVVAGQENTAGKYFRARFARLYSVVIPMLVVAPAADFIGTWIDPEPYAWFTDTDDVVLRVTTAFTFMHESWWTSTSYFSNAPYWSIAYEFWYYVAFGAFSFLTGRKQWVALLAVALVAGPKIIIMFPVWLLGVLVWRILQRRRIPAALAIAVLVLCTFCYTAWVAQGTYRFFEVLGAVLFEPFGVTPQNLAWSWRWLADYYTGILVAGVFISLASLSDYAKQLLSPFKQPIRWLAGATFSIYLLHFPLMHLLAAIIPGRADDPVRVALIGASLIALILLIAEFTERRKYVWANAIDRLARYFASRLRAVSSGEQRKRSQTPSSTI